MSLSKINGGLLDVGGLVVAEREREREVAPMRNQDEDTSKVKHRTIKPKGATVERKSRRHCNYSDGVISEKNVVVSSNSIDFNLLMIKGGSGKKPRII